MNIPTLYKNVHAKKVLKAFALSSLVALSAQAASPIRALVADGNVFMKDNETGRKLLIKTGQTIEEGVTLTTGATGTCVLVFSDGSAIHVGPDSNLMIADHELTGKNKVSTELILVSGEVISNVKKSTRTNYKIGTPAGDIKVTGTTFTVSYDADADATTVTTAEGSVQLSFEGNVLSVPAGYSASSDSGELTDLLEDKGLDGYAFQQALEAASDAGIAAKAAAVAAGMSDADAAQFGNTAAATAFTAAWDAIEALENPSKGSIQLAASNAGQSVSSLFSQLASGPDPIGSGSSVLAQVLAGIDVENADPSVGPSYRSTAIDTHKTNRRDIPVQISPL